MRISLVMQRGQKLGMMTIVIGGKENAVWYKYRDSAPGLRNVAFTFGNVELSLECRLRDGVSPTAQVHADIENTLRNCLRFQQAMIGQYRELYARNRELERQNGEVTCDNESMHNALHCIIVDRLARPS